MKPGGHAGACGGAGGSILIEVLVAVVLLALALGPLSDALQTARERAATVRSAGVVERQVGGSSGYGEAWDWGPRVAHGEWRVGQRLELTVEAGTPGEPSLGLWADGWFLGELALGVDTALIAKIGSLGAATGQELVVRVRLDDGVWGPPWRSIVPDELEPSAGALGPARIEKVPSADPSATVVHPRWLANPTLQLSGASAWAGKDVAGLPIFLALPAEEAVWVELEGDEQSVRGEERRVLDVYF